MMNRSLHFAAILALLTVLALGASAQEGASPGVYIIFDASGSMWGQLPDKTHKIEAARTVLRQFAAGDFGGQDLALRAYGHRRKGDCSDSELVVPFGRAEAVLSAIVGFVDEVNPRGKTPIGLSLRQALADFGDRSGEIILISDGIETCDDDPCALLREWQDRNVAIRVHVVGLGLEEKERSAMQCISEAAGTEYHDAASAEELAAGLARIQQTMQAEPMVRPTGTALVLKGLTPDGNPIKIRGTLTQDGAEPITVKSHARNQVEAGEYSLTAGVLTVNGTLYKPITKKVSMAEAGVTTVEVRIAVPPSVKAHFVDSGKEKRGSQITAYEGGEEVFDFRWIDRVYVNEGTYEFRANPNTENDLSVTESFAAGEHKDIVFELAHTVVVTLKFLASGSGIWLRQNLELVQGDKVFKVHVHNGARVLPGTYDLRLPNKLTPYLHQGVVITDEDKQHYDITIPMGHVTVIYQKADGTRDKDDRAFMGRGADGRRVSPVKRSGKKYPLTPGTYNVTGWSHKGDYDKVVFTIAVGEDKEVVLRRKN